MKAIIPRKQSKIKLSLGAANQRMMVLYEQGRYQESLNTCLEVIRAYPAMDKAWSNAAVNCVKLERWQDAIRYAQTALTHGGNTFALYDALTAAHANLRQWDEVRRYGLRVLNMRARRFGGDPVIPPPNLPPLPPLPSVQTKERNIIAFSLFGGDSRYCEPAVLNVQEQPQIYPHWVCRFYVDGSVPEHVINRLGAGGAQIVRVEGPAAQWPGPMWRLLALNDPQVHRILFRDADSLISRREAAAVEQWLTSGKRFHMMRDSYTHTELILAGLWGVVNGSLPPLEQLMQRFMSEPLKSRHFADQFFLRQYIWPYARTSLMQHDSLFGFMDAVPFPDVKLPEGFHVGHAEGLAFFVVKSNLPDGSKVTWNLYRIDKSDDGQTCQELIYAYPGTIKDGALTANIPTCYGRWLRQGAAFVRVLG